jgi:glycosyltransferase involved in cell wall biosynthesis
MSDGLHVLHLTPRLTRAAGGAWHYVEGLSRALESAGLKSVVAGVAEPDNTDAAGLEVTQVVTGAPTLLPANYGISRKLRRRVLADVARVDVIHAHGFRVGTDLIAMKAARHFGAPIVLSPHGQLHPAIARRGAVKKQLLHAMWGRRYLETIACALGVSETEADVIRAAVPGKPVGALPIGIRPADYRGTRSGYLARHAPGSVGKRVLLYFAYMHPNKGLARLTDAWLALHRDRPDWHLVLAGVDTHGLGAQAAQRLEADGAGGSFSLIGPAFDQDKIDLFADADLFTMPSDAESFGIAFAESLASGVPVIATRGAPWSIVVDHRCGWWVEPTVDALGAALREATALDPVALKAMGERGRSLVQDRFDWLTIAKQVTTLYDWVLGRGDQPVFVR